MYINSAILTTPEMQVLGAVPKVPANYDEHYQLILNRLTVLYAAAEQDAGKTSVCDMISSFLGPDGLTECSSMNAAQIVEDAILRSSAGAAFTADLRDGWEKGKDSRTKWQPSADDIETLQQWIEALTSEYIDI